MKTSVCCEDTATAVNEGDASSSIGGRGFVPVAFEMREMALVRHLVLLREWSGVEDEDVNRCRLCNAGSSSWNSSVFA
jgi:hypothetical protein